MFAGLPGMGVGTLFYVVIALWMPVHELGRTMKGESSIARWRIVAVQFSFAVGIIASITLASEVLAILLGSLSPGSVGVADLINGVLKTNAPESVFAWPIVASLLLLVGILCAIEVFRWIVVFFERRGSDGVATPATFSDEAVNS
jgi:hypothetical protein